MPPTRARHNICQVHAPDCVLDDHHHDDPHVERSFTHHSDHGHVHGRIDPSVVRSRRGLRAVGTSLGVLAVTTVLQVVIYTASGSVALLAELIHNGSDALTA